MTLKTIMPQNGSAVNTRERDCVTGNATIDAQCHDMVYPVSRSVCDLRDMLALQPYFGYSSPKVGYANYESVGLVAACKQDYMLAYHHDFMKP